MKKFIHEENLKLFRKELAETTDPEKRRVLLKLLAEEKADDEQPGLAKRYPATKAAPNFEIDQCNWVKPNASMRHGTPHYPMPPDQHERPDLVGQGSVNRSTERL
jgi:hypothetical protein